MKTSIQSTPGKGRGVYAKEKAKKANLIEVCHLILMKNKVIPNELEGYVFEYDKTHSALALGNGSLYNHSDDANAWVEMEDETLYLYIYAKRKIKKGEEITINYGYSASDRKKFGIKG